MHSFTSQCQLKPQGILNGYCHVLLAAGIFHQVAFSQDEWNGWALSPADDSTLKYIYELGKADGAAWVKHKASTKQ